MRSSVITSSFAAVVTFVVDCLAVAVVALREVLQHTCMREQRSQWHTPRGWMSHAGHHPAGNPWPSFLKLSKRAPYALCPAYAANRRSASLGS
jgi:hypothetical protein